MTGPFSPRVHSSVGYFCPTTSLKMIVGIGLMSFAGAWASGEEGARCDKPSFPGFPGRAAPSEKQTQLFSLNGLRF